MKTLVVKDIPNNETGEKVCKAVKDYQSRHYKKHGRGHRFGGSAGTGRMASWFKPYHQELPLSLAARYTLYGYPKDSLAHQSNGFGREYWRYTGLKNGKPVLRQMSHDYPCRSGKRIGK